MEAARMPLMGTHYLFSNSGKISVGRLCPEISKAYTAAGLTGVVGGVLVGFACRNHESKRLLVCDIIYLAKKWHVSSIRDENVPCVQSSQNCHCCWPHGLLFCIDDMALIAASMLKGISPIADIGEFIPISLISLISLIMAVISSPFVSIIGSFCIRHDAEPPIPPTAPIRGPPLGRCG
ncbi:hypothetical protein B0T20DRAFT_43223 [Sordaria brevicollis]|uniref:Uncharacterized protein n=1 Tax=Sordaria brevicollis TaxID=83679 RepID=A0AAE0P9B0_SORBR|nr:hypothetical protein B0T20DRAFT_43223 [Sordaria brevicollis]